jgi:tRNA U55 pseudouridine synthase TruB
MGQVLGCGAYVQELERTKIGGFRLIEALTLEQLEASFPQETEIQS